MSSSKPAAIQGPSIAQIIANPEITALSKWRLQNESPPCDEQEYVNRARRYSPALAAKLKKVIERIGH